MSIFNWFSKDKPSNVIPFPDQKKADCEKDTPVPEKPAQTFYRIGITDNNRVSFQMGYSEITMTREGVDNLVAQLSVFRDQLYTESEK